MAKNKDRKGNKNTEKSNDKNRKDCKQCYTKMNIQNNLNKVLNISSYDKM